MEKPFKDKVALVTGGSFGIGKATAIAFAKRGAKVLVADWVEDGETLQAISEAGGEAVFTHCDISAESDIRAMVNKVLDTYGQLDFAFNNAGIEGEQAATAECSVENWDKVLGINLRGTWLCMKYELQHFLKKGKGAIVNTASVAGLVGFSGIPAYTASKHGMVGLTKTAALEYAKQGIRINAICPGLIRTPMVDRFTGKDKTVEQQYVDMEPVGRMGEPEEVAEAVLWLCSEAASFVTGHALAVDGGWTAQ